MQMHRLLAYTDLVEPKKTKITLNIGDVVTRKDISARYGGDTQSGMVTPAGGRFIFLFSDPKVVHYHGYSFDGWVTSDQTAFDYTGHGTSGDQQFIRRNEVLRTSMADNREVHLFLAEGFVPGTQRRTHRYAGQFMTDPDHGWRHEFAPIGNGAQRKVIVFTLERVGDFTAPIPIKTLARPASPPTAELQVQEVAAEQTKAVLVHRAETAAMSVTRSERQIEDRLREALRLEFRLSIKPAGSRFTLYTDVWDPDQRELYEVKSSSARQNIRMAIGQLLDYSRYIDGPEFKCVVVIPEHPGEDLIDFVLRNSMDLIYWDANGKQIRRYSQ